MKTFFPIFWSCVIFALVLFIRSEVKLALLLGGGPAPTTCGSSQVRGQTCVTAATRAAKVTTPDPLPTAPLWELQDEHYFCLSLWLFPSDYSKPCVTLLAVAAYPNKCSYFSHKNSAGNSHCDSAVTDLTSIHEDSDLIPGLTQ